MSARITSTKNKFQGAIIESQSQFSIEYLKESTSILALDWIDDGIYLYLCSWASQKKNANNLVRCSWRCRSQLWQLLVAYCHCCAQTNIASNDMWNFSFHISVFGQVLREENETQIDRQETGRVLFMFLRIKIGLIKSLQHKCGMEIFLDF